MKRQVSEILALAREFHNKQDVGERIRFSISSGATQITTLQTMKYKIQENAKRQCFEINQWINNIAESIEEDLEKEGD